MHLFNVFIVPTYYIPNNNSILMIMNNINLAITIKMFSVNLAALLLTIICKKMCVRQWTTYMKVLCTFSLKLISISNDYQHGQFLSWRKYYVASSSFCFAWQLNSPINCNHIHFQTIIIVLHLNTVYVFLFQDYMNRYQSARKKEGTHNQ